MNKCKDSLKRRRQDVLAMIENAGAKEVSLVVKNFAHLHYLSEATVWKDYHKALEDKARRLTK